MAIERGWSRPRAALAIAGWLFVAAGQARAETFRTEGSCREGVAHGAWQLIGANGQPRALGAFAHGKRTGSFIFWSATGVRIAHVPYDDDAKHGTLALWYDAPARDAPSAQRLEAKFVHGAPDGVTTVWDRDGRRRGEYRYSAGRLVDALAWDARGRPLGGQRARAQAESDALAHERQYRALDRLVERHLPRCPSDAPVKPQ
jgi:hypothetical protein